VAEQGSVRVVMTRSQDHVEAINSTSVGRSSGSLHLAAGLPVIWGRADPAEPGNADRVHRRTRRRLGSINEGKTQSAPEMPVLIRARERR